MHKDTQREKKQKKQQNKKSEVGDTYKLNTSFFAGESGFIKSPG